MTSILVSITGQATSSQLISLNFNRKSSFPSFSLILDASQGWNGNSVPGSDSSWYSE
ncbi:hypothetical protein LEP1GSC178_2202 [Leptospira licerasiae str. MMD4847]|uniref:Uncharacterized protein n=1 Tax=Leptospira licerasiae str. MMD4847 TaxID=1049971 RepID=A0ABN0HDW3_9LEPT|nr:hypothetical protein LEP1GSC178_2202 [Leptospira licerasiae str. MMD4847]